MILRRGIWEGFMEELMDELGLQGSADFPETNSKREGVKILSSSRLTISACPAGKE